jgi:hypothetical protein
MAVSFERKVQEEVPRPSLNGAALCVWGGACGNEDPLGLTNK